MWYPCPFCYDKKYKFSVSLAKNYAIYGILGTTDTSAVLARRSDRTQNYKVTSRGMVSERLLFASHACLGSCREHFLPFPGTCERAR